MSVWDIIKENGQKTIQTFKKFLFKTFYFFIETIKESYIYIKVKEYSISMFQTWKTTSSYYETIRLWKFIKRLFWQSDTVYEEYWCVMAYWCLWGCYSFLIGFALLIIRPVLFLIWASFIFLVSFTAMGHKIRTPHTLMLILAVFYPHYIHNAWIKQQKRIKKEDELHCKNPELYLFLFIILAITSFLIYVVLQNRSTIKDFLEKFSNTLYYLQRSKKYRYKAFNKTCDKYKEIIVALIMIGVFSLFKRVKTFFMLAITTKYLVRIKKQLYSFEEILILKLKLDFKIIKRNFKKSVVINNYLEIFYKYLMYYIFMK